MGNFSVCKYKTADTWNNTAMLGTKYIHDYTKFDENTNVSLEVQILTLLKNNAKSCKI